MIMLRSCLGVKALPIGPTKVHFCWSVAAWSNTNWVSWNKAPVNRVLIKCTATVNQHDTDKYIVIRAYYIYI